MSFLLISSITFLMSLLPLVVVLSRGVSTAGL